MEIRFIPNGYSEELSSEGIDAIPEEYLESFIEEFNEYDKAIKPQEVNYGPGADWLWVYVAISGITNLIMLGDQINSGFEGWAKLGDKLKKLITQSSHIAFDKDALSALSINHILELNKDVTVIKKVIEYEIDVPVYSGTMSKDEISNFLEKTEIYYVQGYEINSKSFILFGSNRDGKLEILKTINM